MNTYFEVNVTGQPVTLWLDENGNLVADAGEDADGEQLTRPATIDEEHAVWEQEVTEYDLADMYYSSQR